MTQPATGANNATVLAALADAIRSAAAFDKNDQVAPAVVLWPDEEKGWADLLPKLREVMPELLTLGAFDAATKTGPAIWVKAMLGKGEDGAPLHPLVSWPKGATPILYMPGISRQHIRAIEECPRDLKPLCELQFRGAMWTQVSGKDWTPRAFLQSSDGGLGLNLAGDSATLGAMRQSLEKLADVPLVQLQGRPLDAGDFHELLAPDPSRTVLEWLSDAAAFRVRAGAGWAAFRTVCKDKFGFDPEKMDATKAGQLLAERQGPWSGVWSRFEESPTLYPGVRDVLRRSKPAGGDSLFGSGLSVYPQDNEASESELRAELLAIGKLSDAAARAKVLELEQRHAPRRSLVWAKLGEAPLATALWHLSEMARLAAVGLGGADRDHAAALYAESGWRVDDAAIQALASAKSAADLTAVGSAVRAVYGPWLEKAAENFQKLVAAKPLPSAGERRAPDDDAGTCIVFADGLRMDLGQRLAAELAKRGLTVSVTWQWSTVPTVTATAKPAASPMVSKLSTSTRSDDFVPQLTDGLKNLTSERFRSALRELDVDVLGAGEHGKQGESRAWVEVGTIDHRGHGEGVRLASMLGDEVRLVADRVADLVAAGWTTVRVVTDHGWLLLPGGLPKVTLPKYLVETNWRRCASVKENASPECQQHGWHWNPTISIALAPGISCFREGAEYAHGGLSVQEMVTPVVTVTTGGNGPAAKTSATVASIVWNQLTGRVQVAGAGGAAVDLRTEAADPKTTLLDSEKPRPIDANGQAKIYARDEADGLAAEVVVLDADGNVIARRRTRVGME
ncbi:MAG: BREX-1 system phosphatase PglZ type B [Phycisphaerales bacterium]